MNNKNIYFLDPVTSAFVAYIARFVKNLFNDFPSSLLSISAELRFWYSILETLRSTECSFVAIRKDYPIKELVEIETLSLSIILLN